jgi:hypothetical protein
VKQAKATLAKLDGTTSKGTGSSMKPYKKHKEAAATAGQPDPDLQAEYVSNLEKAKEATEKAKAKAELAAQEMFQLYVNLLSVDASSCGIRSSMSRHNPTTTQTYKASPRKDPGDICASHSTTA